MKFKLDIKEHWQRFKHWRERPYQVNPLSDEWHKCECCHTNYQGNYCPRCGQSSRVGRYSFKIACVNFVDVWGLGNRSMFRTIRDLILRPGYMIRDFLKGMQMAYFPPFQMFFILAAISIMVTHGLNIKGESFEEDENIESLEQSLKNEKTEKESDIYQIKEKTTEDNEEVFSAEQKQIMDDIPTKMLLFVARFNERFPNILSLFGLMFLSGFLYLFFRHCPNIPDLRYSEFFVSLIYANNMYTIYSIVLCFLGLPTLATFTIVLVLVPLKQLSGYSWKRTILKTVAACSILMVLLIGLLIAFAFAIVGYAAIVG